jgi:hypothetical protein
VYDTAVLAMRYSWSIRVGGVNTAVEHEFTMVMVKLLGTDCPLPSDPVMLTVKVPKGVAELHTTVLGVLLSSIMVGSAGVIK